MGQNRLDRLEELAGFEDFSEAVAKELGDEEPDLILDDITVGNTKAIFQSVFTVSTKDRQDRRPHRLGPRLFAAASFADQRALANGEKTLFERFGTAIQAALEVRKPSHFPEQFDLK